MLKTGKIKPKEHCLHAQIKRDNRLFKNLDASEQGGEEEGDGGDGEDEGAAVGGGGKLSFAKKTICEKELIIA